MPICPIYPVAISKWLLNNTKLTLQQISDFTSVAILDLHSLQLKSNNILPKDPIELGILTQEEINECEQNSSASLKITENYFSSNEKETSKLSRNKKIAIILWFEQAYPILSAKEISKFISSTEKFVSGILENKSKFKNVSLVNPIEESICSLEEIKAIIKNK